MFYSQLVVWTFNVVLLGFDLVGTLVISRSRRVGPLVTVISGMILAATSIAVVLGGETFLVMRLFAYVFFCHLPLTLLVAAGFLASSHRRSAVMVTLLAGMLLAVAVDALWIEPTWLQETRLQLTSDKVLQPVRIVILADLQTDRLGPYERDVFQRCMAAQPDLILLAGDYIQVYGTESREALRREINGYLRTIGFSAPLGIYAVQGNVDQPLWHQLFEGLPVTRLDETRSLTTGPVQITGLQLMDSFNRRLRVAACSRFHIVLGHAPDFALGDIESDLLVAGHTHGGQVRLPWIGPLVTGSNVPRSWAAGVTELDSRRTLIVSRGIGMERRDAPRLRFLCRPELVVLDVLPTPTVTTAQR